LAEIFIYAIIRYLVNNFLLTMPQSRLEQSKSGGFV